MSHSWDSSDRKQRLPGNWESLRQLVLKRDSYRCCAQTLTGRCTNSGTDVDHIKRGDDHSLSNLQTLCAGHHKAKTSREGYLAYKAKRREQAKRIASNFIITEKHPGAIRQERHLQPWERK